MLSRRSSSANSLHKACCTLTRLVSNSRAESASDPSGSVRAPGTARLVDVEMTVRHVVGATVGTTPHGASTDDDRYLYTLELAADGRIIGGEWVSSNHPDFLWRPTAKPQASADGLITLADVSSLIEGSQEGNPGPGPGPGPSPGPGPGELSEGTPLAFAILRLVNTQTVPQLSQVVGLSLPSARRVHAYVAGPDQNRGTPDDQAFASIQGLSTVLVSGELDLMSIFVIRNGWVN